MRAILSSRAAHRWEVEKRRWHNGRKQLRTTRCKLTSVSILLVSTQHVCQPFRANAQPFLNHSHHDQWASLIPHRVYTHTHTLSLSLSLSCTLSTTSSKRHPARPDSPTSSVGTITARLMELEPEKDHWRRIARDWYAHVVTEYPGRGKLHHHLGLLSCKAEGKELWGVYHFVKRCACCVGFNKSDSHRLFSFQFLIV